MHCLFGFDLGAVLEFTEPSYTGGESTSRVTVGVELLTSVNIEIIVEIVAVNLTFVSESQLILPLSFPAIPDDDPRQPTEASSKLLNHVTCTLPDFEFSCLLL